MKLKELHLRNIASIEKADIDFEKGLIDSSSGNIAQMFLISGDTGSGKSVIMDGITLALYKKTPRLAGVSNPNNNKYKTLSGQELAINSIYQYAKIGIGPNDECYSEVLIEAGDGNDYWFRLDLGCSKASVKAWQYKPSNGQWNKCTEDIAIAIIGQNFEQFRRISMLAQGQFETFLVGAKDEREKILEQLTDTQIFSAYGEAIKKLADRMKDEFTNVKTAYETQSANLLDSAAVAKLQSEQQTAETEEKRVRQEKNVNDEKLRQVGIIDSAKDSKAKAEQEKQKLDITMSSDAFKADQTLVSDWDNTVTERQKLADRDDAKQKKQKEQVIEGIYQKEFAKLSSDFEAKKKDLENNATSLDQQKSWLDSMESKRDMYGNSGAICQKIDSYSDTIKLIDSKSASLNEEQSKTATLADSLNKAETDLDKATKDVTDIQNKIDSYTDQRIKLDPEKVNKQISEAHKKLSSLEALKKSDSDLVESKKKLDKKREELANAEKDLEVLQKNAKIEKEVREKASKLYEEALGLYATMNASLDEKLVDLRKQLSVGDTCPLCGTVISKVLSDDAFKKSLTPLEQKRDQAKDVFDKADLELRKSSKAVDTAEGKISSKRTEIEEIADSILKEEKKLSSQAEKLGVDLSKIADAIDDVTGDQNRLLGIQSQAESLQKEIDKLQKQKKPLDSAKSNAEKVKTEAEQALLSNRQSISSDEKQIEELSTRKQHIESEISSAIGKFFPDWTKDPALTSNTLSSQSGEYNNKSERYSKDCHAQTLLQNTIEIISDIRGKILSIHPQWDCPYQAISSGVTENEWNSLSNKISACATKIRTLDETIQDCEAVLVNSSKSESELVSIETRGKGTISDIKKRIKDTENDLSRQIGAISSADKQIKDAMTELGISDIDMVPEKQDLESVGNTLSSKLSDLSEKIGTIKSQLDNNANNQAQLDTLKNKLDAAELQNNKWQTLCNRFGGTRLRTIVQTYIMGPLLAKANLFMAKMTDRYELTCSDENEQLAILVKDKYNRDEIRSATVLSGGERFMISLALSLALSSLNKPGLMVNMLFIDEGFGTLDQINLESVMTTLETLQNIAGQSNRRVCIISHREELMDRITVQIQVVKKGSGSRIQIKTA